jgi:hypothetical protein
LHRKRPKNDGFGTKQQNTPTQFQKHRLEQKDQSIWNCHSFFNNLMISCRKYTKKLWRMEKEESNSHSGGRAMTVVERRTAPAVHVVVWHSTR